MLSLCRHANAFNGGKMAPARHFISKTLSSCFSRLMLILPQLAMSAASSKWTPTPRAFITYSTRKAAFIWRRAWQNVTIEIEFLLSMHKSPHSRIWKRLTIGLFPSTFVGDDISLSLFRKIIFAIALELLLIHEANTEMIALLRHSRVACISSIEHDRRQ